MASILVCTRREDVVAELTPLLLGERQVAIVPNVADAVRSLLLGRFDAVVLDMDDETIPRLEALPVISRFNPRTPILAVSGQVALEVEAAIRAAGIFGLLVRPLSPGELERHLAAALYWPLAGTWRPASTADANNAAAASR